MMPSIREPSSVHSATKLAKICDSITLLFSKSTTYSDSSVAHLLIMSELSLLPKIPFNG
jgi:hypothetical protein